MVQGVQRKQGYTHSLDLQKKGKKGIFELLLALVVAVAVVIVILPCYAIITPNLTHRARC